MKSKDQQLLEEAYGMVLLNELFDNPFPYKKQTSLPGYGGPGGEEYEKQAEYVFSTSEGGEGFPKYTVTFNLFPEEGTLDIVFFYESQPGKGTYDLTGTGNAPKIMGTIIDIVKKYLEEKIQQFGVDCNYITITFSSKTSEGGRLKLYDTLASLVVRFMDQKTGIKWYLITRQTGTVKVYDIKRKPRNTQIDSAEPNQKTPGSLKRFLYEPDAK